MRLWRSRKTRQQREDDLDRELRSHLDLEAEEREAEGIPAEDARFAALRQFGTTALFSVLNAAMLRTLPVSEPGRLVVIQPEVRGKHFPWFNPFFEEIRNSQ